MAASQKQEENEILAHRFHMDMFQKRDLSTADKILAADFVWRNPIIPSELTHGPESAKKIASAVINSVPDLRITHDDTFSKNDKVLVRWTMTGTAKKELFGIPASEKPLTLVGFDLFRIANGKIVEMWQQFSVGRWS
ncbi:MAG: ester cyclase [Nitrososphaeraceae archaeon]